MTEHPITDATPLASEQITQPITMTGYMGAITAGAPFVMDYGQKDVEELVRVSDVQPADDVCCKVRLEGTTFWMPEIEFRRRATPFIPGTPSAALSASPAPSGQGVSGEVAPSRPDPRGIQCAACHKRVETTSAGYCFACIKGFKVPDVAAPAPSCAPGEVEQARNLIESIARPFPPNCNWEDQARACQAVAEQALTVLAALSPQGLDAKEGGE